MSTDHPNGLLTGTAVVSNDCPVGEITLRLPAAPPELYLQGVAWGREAVRFAASAATMGRSIERVRGHDRVMDLVLYDGPERIEAAARRAIEEGRSVVSPTLRLDAELVALAHARAERLWDSILKLLPFGGPRLTPEIEALHEEMRARTERALAEVAPGAD
jgi:hypothetical protein